MARIYPDAQVAALLAPVRALVDRGLGLLPDAPPLEIVLGDCAGFYAVNGDRVVLSEALDGPGIHHPGEATGPLPPLDRWRRAAGSVLEAVSLTELARRSGVAPQADWRWLGGAIHAADAVAPELGLAAPDLALAVGAGRPGRDPRAGVAAMRAWQAQGIDPIRRVRYLLDGGVVSATEWLKLGSWVLSPSGGMATLPVRVERVPDADIPLELPAWSWQPLRVPAHARGGRIAVDGDGAVSEAWATAGADHRAMAASAGTPCRLDPDPGGPVGSWEVASAEGFGQVMGARGVTFVFRGDGWLELVLADAFVGPLAAVTMAGEVGTSGTCRGRWRVAGPFLLRFDEIQTHALTMHGRRDRFLVPAQGFGMGEWIAALSEDVWAWHPAGPERLVLRGRMMGGEVEVRLRAAS